MARQKLAMSRVTSRAESGFVACAATPRGSAPMLPTIALSTA
jgi:hypothetical protein